MYELIADSAATGIFLVVLLIAYVMIWGWKIEEPEWLKTFFGLIIIGTIVLNIIFIIWWIWK